ncbi:MAG: alpha-methylacyl-CoA racemase [Bradyrhizobium sp.]|jgi:alpha-methylacyl-CoA racemase|nr:alpha-methylacyl-CoA racemase [Bradyrhizobium sp.]
MRTPHTSHLSIHGKSNVLDKSAPESSSRTSGPLTGLRVVEFAGIGPGPFACMLLADMGAEVVTLDRVGAGKSLKAIAWRGRKLVELDLKDKGSIARVLDLLANADALIEGFRPGVMERLGLGPEVVQARNPRLVYGRMTGWGQKGPLAQAAGHDINYISLTGALSAIGPRERPVPPLNLVGDFGGGALYLVVGVLAALLEAKKSGRGQVVDAAMCDGAASLLSMFFDMKAGGRWIEGRENNFLDGGAHFYGVYECACGNFISIGSIEPQFYALLRQLAGLTDAGFDGQMDRKAWPALKKNLIDVFKTKTRDEWCKIMEGTDVCFAPVLTMAEAPQHPHMAAREVFVSRHGVTQPAPAPRFSRTPSTIREPATADIAGLTKEWQGRR